MEKTKEGDKPQNTTPEETYSDKIASIIQTLTASKLKGQKVDVRGAIRFLDPTEDNSAIRDWLVANADITPSAFNKIMASEAKRNRVEDELGFVPNDVLDFVRRYTERNKISLSPRGTISRNRAHKAGQEVIDITTKDTCRETRMIYDVANATGDNLMSLARELRLISERLELGYRDQAINDALDTWQEEVNRESKIEALLSIAYTKGKPTGEAGQAMWLEMERACFNVQDTKPGFAIAVIKKFMWQVKRKARGLPVTNHLMPVISGAQGKGKTQFVLAMTRPLAQLMREVDFNLITDGKTTDIWSSLILFIDEMGHFTKTDVDVVKNVITSEDRTIRTMRSNSSAQVRNEATLIGCTNQSLELLIRDSTGVRRFAELVWRNDPDWEASNKLDWVMLWQSVDEEGPDPIFEANMADTMREQQESNRAQHPVEQWVREFAPSVKEWTLSADLHASYRLWEKDAAPRMDTGLLYFGKLLSNMISTMPDFPLEKTTTRKGKAYRAKRKEGEPQVDEVLIETVASRAARQLKALRER